MDDIEIKSAHRNSTQGKKEYIYDRNTRITG